MSNAASGGQALQVTARVATQVNWNKLDSDLLQRDVISLSPKEFGRRFTAFLKNGARMPVAGGILAIDRTTPFDPASFIGAGWSIIEQDERALALHEVNLANIRLENCLRKCESVITGEERIKRLKGAGYTRLDAKAFQTLWENQDRISESWKEKTNGSTTYIFFDGTSLRSPLGGRCVLYLDWNDGRWHWRFHWLAHARHAGSPSAVLASI